MALLKRSSKSAPAKGKAKPAPKKKAKAPRGAKIKQIGVAFKSTRAQDPKMLPLVLAAFFGPVALFVVVGLVLGLVPYLTFLGVMVGLVAAAFVFGRRVQTTAYSQVEGQLGAAAAVLSNMRGDWRVAPAVAFNREQDLLHRVIGKPGVVLVAEGSSNRVRNLIAGEKKKVSRIIGDTPVYEVIVGEGEGRVGLRQLERHFLKLPRNIKGKQVNDLDRKFKAMPTTSLPIPKGPMPTRVPRR